jgi:hypothetical protein
VSSIVKRVPCSGAVTGGFFSARAFDHVAALAVGGKNERDEIDAVYLFERRPHARAVASFEAIAPVDKNVLAIKHKREAGSFPFWP